MDLKHKGITWVGNMFQKFEAVCQEVDDIIKQDTVKYVETQVSSARENVKKLCSDVVQGILPPIVNPVKHGAKAEAQRGHVPITAYVKSPSHNDGKTSNNVVNKSSVGHGTTSQIDNQSQASCKVNFVNEEVAQVSNHSFLELKADIPLEKNMTENVVHELLSEKSDGTLTYKFASMESNASDPLSRSLRNDDVILIGNNGEGLTDKDATKSSKDDTTMEFNDSDPLKHIANSTPCQVKVTNKEATLILDNSQLPLESSRLSRKNDNDLSDEDSDDFKKVVIMEPNATDHLNNNYLSQVWSGINFVSKEADDSNLLSKSEVLSGRIDHALIDKDFNKSPLKDIIFENDPNSYLLNLPSHGNEVGFTCKEAITVSDRNHLDLEPELLSRKNDDALTNQYSYEIFKNDTIWELEHDASYPLSNSIKYKNDEVSSVSNYSSLKLESEVFCEKNSEALIDKASDASCKEQANLELSTELTLHCDEESTKETLCSSDKKCEEDIVTPTGNPQETSIHGADVESTHTVGQTSSTMVNNLVDLSLRMETISKYLNNGTGGSSNAPDASSLELPSVVLTSEETVEETKLVSFLKPLSKGSISDSRSLVNNFSSSTVVHEKPANQRASIECETRLSFEVVTSASYENKALEMRFVSSRSSSSSMESPGTHASRPNENEFLPKFRTTSQVEFSGSTSSGALSFSTEVGCPYNSSGYFTDAEMETVDLGHKMTLKDECDVVDYKALHAVSRRTQKLRSYKKRIQDAFSSKKRLAKEYEQLAIWYGDTDLEFSTDSSQKLDAKNVSTSYASDSEWELL